MIISKQKELEESHTHAGDDAHGHHHGSNLGIVIFIAILMHKIPASVGLGTFLKHNNLSQQKFVMYLSAFTATSPIATVLTYLPLLLLDVVHD